MSQKGSGNTLSLYQKIREKKKKIEILKKNLKRWNCLKNMLK